MIDQKKKLIRSNYCFVGHPVYMQFLHQCYNLGEIEFLKFYNKKQMCIVLPYTMSEKQIMTLKKPIYSANKIMAGFISKKIKSLTSSWEPEATTKPMFKVEVIPGGYNFYVAIEISKDYNIIDFQLKKRLKEYRGHINGYYLYHIPLKEIRGLFWALEQRDIIWFVD